VEQRTSPTQVPAQTPPDDELISWWGLVVEAYAHTSEAMAADLLATGGLEPRWFEVLLRLERTPGHRLSMTDLAHQVSFSSGGFTKLADRLESAGYVVRSPSENDRRVIWMVLTPAGASVIRDAKREHAGFLRSNVMGTLGRERFEQLGELMRVLRDRTAPKGEIGPTE